MKDALFTLTLCSVCSVSVALAPSDAKRLYDAVIANDIEAVSQFLESGGSPNVVISQVDTSKEDVQHWTGPMLELALLAGHDDIASILLEAGADVSKVKIDDSVLRVATQQGMSATIAQLLERDPSKLIAGTFALEVASDSGRYDIVALMLQYANEAGIHWGDRLNVALRGALQAGHEDIARLLLKAGASPLSDGVIHAAVANSNVGIVHDLLEAGASESMKFEERSPLDFIAIRMNECREYPSDEDTILRELIKAGADICGFAPQTGGLSQSVLDEFRSVAPQCDWPRAASDEKAT